MSKKIETSEKTVASPKKEAPIEEVVDTVEVIVKKRWYNLDGKISDPGDTYTLKKDKALSLQSIGIVEIKENKDKVVK